MTIEILFTMIAALGAVTGIILNWWNAHKKGAEEEAVKQKSIASLDFKVEQLIRKVDKIDEQLERLVNHEIKLADFERRIVTLEKKAGV